VPNTALLVQTANANGEWALSTQDKISAANVTTNSQTLVAVAASDATLERGNLVAAAGLAPAVPENQYPLPLVRLSTGQERAGIVGVVEGRMALEPAPDKEGELILHSVAGPAKAGDYVAITVLGVARAKIAPDTETQPGQRLTVGQQPGTTRALRTTQVDGMTVDEGGPSLGMALE
jgi:hypothetical protein